MEDKVFRKKGRPSQFQKSFILHVVKFALEHEMTFTNVGRHFNIPRVMVSRWVKVFHSELGGLNSIGPMATNSPVVQRDHDCAEQTKALQKALEQAQFKVTVLETMIDLAESTYKISIRKNSGTKQP
jgi:hypothetical protein